MAAADSRREALLAAGCSTYVAYGGSITCLCCGFVSQHPEDREHRYCGFCHKFHTDWSKRA